MLGSARVNEQSVLLVDWGAEIAESPLHFPFRYGQMMHMTNRRDWDILWIVVLSVAFWGAVWEHEPITRWIHWFIASRAWRI
jgi:hypothetical protein